MSIEELRLVLDVLVNAGTTAAWFALAYHILPQILTTVGWIVVALMFYSLAARLHNYHRMELRFDDLLQVTKHLHGVTRGNVESPEGALSRVVAALAKLPK